MSSSIGEFTLQRVIGRGGMGQVWAARHGRLGARVAMKVLRPGAGGDSTGGWGADRPLDALRHEIRAMARLDHPGIAWIHDFGEVTAEDASASGGTLAPGSPWIAMELASGGNLASIPRLMGWTELRPFLLALLDALAHAHAHDLVHRDLKPANILICGPGDLRPGIKLADFGIAQALDDDGSGQRRFVGTPHYMAPEQVVGASRRAGPWTDLYSLGCVAWLLATGKRPFADHTGEALVRAQLSQAPPAFMPVVNVPDGFEGWVRQLLQKHPRDRFRSAADAAWGLQTLDDAPEEQSLPLELPGLFPSGEPSAGPSIGDFPAGEDDPTEIEDPTEEAVVTERVLARHVPAVAVVPATWRRPLADGTPRPVGTALFGLRPIPVVGRTGERDTLWNALLEVRRTGRMQVLVLQGPSGVGKSRLAEWFVRRAAEVGAADALRAPFQEDEPVGEALRRAWVRAFRTVGLTPELASKLVARTLRDLGTDDPGLLDGAHEILREDGALDAQSRYTLMNMLLALFCRARPHIIWLDDLHWGLDGIRWVASLARAQEGRPLPVLVVATAQDEAMADRPALSAELGALAATHLALGPLPPAHQAELVQSMLGLDPTLAAQVVDRTAGNPLFAVQLVGDWVEAGALTPGDRGLVLAPGAEVLPQSVQALLSDRVERVLAGLPSIAGELLEVAAVLGPDVDRAGWRGACPTTVGSVDLLVDTLNERLITARLAEETARGFVFVHTRVVEALRERARRAGRLATHGAAAARMIRASGAGPELAERLGRFLLLAGRPEEAVEPLLAGARRRRVRLGNGSALALVELCEQAARALPDGAPLRWRVRLERAVILANLGELDAALEVVSEVEAEIGRPGLDPVVGNGLRALAELVRSQVARDRGDHAGCEASALAAVRLAGTDGDPEILAPAWWMATLAAVDTGRPGLLRERAELTCAALMRRPDGASQAEAHRMMAFVDLEEGEPGRALPRAREALELYRRLGSVNGAARSLLAIGDALYLLGRLDDAERALNESCELFEVWSPSGGVRPRVSLAYVRAARGDAAGAYARVAGLVRDPDPRGDRASITRAWVLMAECCATLGSWAEFDHAIEQVRQRVRARPRAELGELDSLDRSQVICRAGGHLARADRVSSIVDAQRAARDRASTNSSTNRV